MKNILWLVSWYPNRFDLSNANFIQHQAQAVSKFAKVHVLYVHADETGAVKKREEENFQNGNLTEQIIYYPSDTKNFFSKLASINRYYSLSKQAIQKFINENGVPDYVHVQVPVRAGAIALWVKRKFGVKYALTEHYGIYNRVVVDPWVERSLVYKNGVKKMIANAQSFICVSKQLGDDVNREVLKKNYISIPNVVDTSLFHFEKKIKEHDNSPLPERGVRGEDSKKNQKEKFQFIHVSNMIPLKNVEGIIDAAKILSETRSDFEVKIIGRTTPAVLKHTEQSGLLNRNIFFSGEIPYAQVATEMNEADAFILFSRSESSSCVVQESLCCGLPVIATPVGIALETINNANGFLTPVDNVKSLSEKMNELMNSKLNFNREKISEEYCRQFNHEVVGKKIFDAYGF